LKIESWIINVKSLEYKLIKCKSKWTLKEWTMSPSLLLDKNFILLSKELKNFRLKLRNTARHLVRWQKWNYFSNHIKANLKISMKRKDWLSKKQIEPSLISKMWLTETPISWIMIPRCSLSLFVKNQTHSRNNFHIYLIS